MNYEDILRHFGFGGPGGGGGFGGFESMFSGFGQEEAQTGKDIEVTRN
jgi:hypothetical protein